MLVLLKDIDRLTFFHPDLEFHLFVPIFGFIGAMIFVIDLFQGREEIERSGEFALRLVLGPYVATVSVLLFQESVTFVDISNTLKAQAALAFLSGFLVTLFLQGLTERGNEILGHWRERFRYEQSQIAEKFDLDREDDLNLRTKASLKYLRQLRTLPDSELEGKSRQAGIGEEFMRTMRRQLREEHLRARLGKETWAKLEAEGVRTVRDVALLTDARIKEIADNQSLDPEALRTFHKEASAV